MCHQVFLMNHRSTLVSHFNLSKNVNEYETVINVYRAQYHLRQVSPPGFGNSSGNFLTFLKGPWEIFQFAMWGGGVFWWILRKLSGFFHSYLLHSSKNVRDCLAVVNGRLFGELPRVTHGVCEMRIAMSFFTQKRVLVWLLLLLGYAI